MSISKCSLFNHFSSYSSKLSRNPSDSFKLSDYLKDHPIPQEIEYNSTQRSWLYLTGGNEGFFNPKTVSGMDLAAINFFNIVRDICKGTIPYDYEEIPIPLEESLGDLYGQTLHLESNAYSVLKIALRSARQELKRPSAPKEAIQNLIGKLEQEKERLLNQHQKEHLESSPFKTSRQLAKETRRHSPISWKTVAFVGGLLLSGGLGFVCSQTLKQKELLNGFVGETAEFQSPLSIQRQNFFDFNHPLIDRLSTFHYCYDSRPEFVQRDERIQIASKKWDGEDRFETVSRLRKKHDQHHAKLKWEQALSQIADDLPLPDRDSKYDAIAKEMMKFGNLDEAIELSIKITDPNLRNSVFLGAVEILLKKRDRFGAAALIKKFPEAPFAILRDSAYRKIVEALLTREYNVDLAMEYVQEIEDDSNRDSAYREIVDFMIENSKTERLLEAVSLISNIPDKNLTSNQALEFFLQAPEPDAALVALEKMIDDRMAKGDVEGARTLLADASKALPTHTHPILLKLSTKISVTKLSRDLEEIDQMSLRIEQNFQKIGKFLSECLPVCKKSAVITKIPHLDQNALPAPQENG